MFYLFHIQHPITLLKYFIKISTVSRINIFLIQKQLMFTNLFV